MRTPALLLAAVALSAGDATVTRVLDRFTIATWAAPSWTAAKTWTAQVPDAMRMQVVFTGEGFQWGGINPGHPLVVPGRSTRISLEFKGVAGYPVSLGFNDGWGRGKVDGTDLKAEWKPTGEWQTASFDVPAGWVQPVSVTGVTVHNGDSQKTVKTIEVMLRGITVTTDTAAVDPQTGAVRGWTAPPDKPDMPAPTAPLFAATLRGAAQANVFAGDQPAITVDLRSWLPGTVNGTASWTVKDLDGKPVGGGELPAAVEDGTSLKLAPPAPRFGVYRLAISVAMPGQKPFTSGASYAVLPKPIALTPAEHDASPYGLCVHGGRNRLPDAFMRAGIRWYRDYAFNWEWTRRSEGDGAFTGWPDHRAIADDYLSRGLGFLPIICDAISHPSKDAAPGSAPVPDAAFDAHLARLLKAFPTIRHWELDNEYDLRNAGYEAKDGWKHYNAWHTYFAEALHRLSGGTALAVENGRAGIFPELLRDAVTGGAFAGIDIANVHHYCGADAPERNITNNNTAFADGVVSPPTLFADRLRDTVAAATADGRKRPVWITEFGWDDLAGPRVPTAQKTAWLPRGFLSILSAGVEKGFWFFDCSIDPAKASTFFDGCGLVDQHLEPEPALAAMAGLAQVLPAPHWVGPLALPDGIEGAVLESRGTLVAALWTVDGKPRQLAVQATELRDVFANPLPAGPVTLGEAPVYALGIPADGELARQAAYDIASHRYIRVCAGDRATVTITASRAGEIVPQLPAGWTATPASQAIAGQAGKPASIDFAITIPPGQAAGEQAVRFAIRESGAALALRTLRVEVAAPLVIEPPRIAGEPGEVQLQVRVKNQSATAHPAKLTLSAPAGWTVPADGVDVPALAPGELRSIAVPLSWKPLSGADNAAVALTLAGFPDQRRSILAPQRVLPRAGRIALDGDLADWPAGALYGADLLGCTSAADAEIGAAWHEDGLYVAVRTTDGGRATASPKTFWMQDALEVFIAADGRADKRDWRPEDMHFWLVPQADAGRAWVGRWQHRKEHAATANDLPDIASKVVKRGDGYVMECLIPKRLILAWDPKPGARMGVALTLSVHGARGEREVYWPLAKADGMPWQPGLWGAWILGR